MKKLLLFFALISAFATAIASEIKDLVNDYSQVSEALIAANPAKASETSKLFLEHLKQFNTNSLNESQQKSFQKIKPRIEKYLIKIAATNNIEDQRKHFGALSPIVWNLVKNSGYQQALYYNYCPMKEFYWISLENNIRNPYYGSKMLKCGDLSEKIN